MTNVTKKDEKMSNEVKKVAWLSRHEMSPEQKYDLERVLGCEVEVTTKNITWAASEDAEADFNANAAIWCSLASFDVITGVFPPVCLNAQACCSKPIYSSISRQAPELRVGDGPIPFQHMRWEKLINGAMALWGLQEISEMAPCSDYDCIMTARGFLEQC